MSRIYLDGATYVELSTQMIVDCQFIVNFLRQSEKLEIYINNKEYRALSREKYLTKRCDKPRQLPERFSCCGCIIKKG